MFGVVEESLVKEDRWCQIIERYIFVEELLCGFYVLDSESACIEDFDVLELAVDLGQSNIVHFWASFDLLIYY